MKRKRMAVYSVATIFVLMTLPSISAIEYNTTPKLKPRYWAIIIAPPGSADVNDLFVKDAKYLQDTLIHSGWNKRHIKSLLYEDATSSNFVNAIKWIAANDAPSDTTLICMIDHGFAGGFKTYSDCMLYSDLDAELDKLDSGAIGIIIDACYSGSAIPYLQQDGRVIITACRDDETAGSGLVRILCSGLIGFADKKEGVGNNNGAVSLEEAFDFYFSEGYDFNWFPQIQDNYEDELDVTFLDAGYDKIDQFPNFHCNGGHFVSVGMNSECDDYQVSQSFRPTVNVLTKVLLMVDHYPQIADFDVTVSIRKNLDGSDLTSVSVSASKLYEYSGYHVFDFQDIKVIENDTYYIVVRVLPGDPMHYSLAGRADNSYERGEHLISSDYGQTWHINQFISDLFFATYGYNSGKAKAINTPILNFLKNHPNIFPLLQKLVQQLQ